MADVGKGADHNCDKLRKVSLFRELSDDDCDAVLRSMRPVRFGVGDIVFEQGDVGDTMLVVADGLLRVELTDTQGRTTDLGSIGTNQFVGEMAAFDPAPRSATVVAATDTEVYELSVHALRELRRTAPGAAAAITSGVIGDITSRLRGINDRIDRELNPNAARVRSQVRASGIHTRGPAVVPARDSGSYAASAANAPSQQVGKVEEQTGFSKFWSRLFGG